MDLALDLASCLFLFLTGAFCIGWAVWRHETPWRGSRKWMMYTLKPIALLSGLYHILFSMLKALYVLLWWATT